jgi:hypothetical protein
LPVVCGTEIPTWVTDYGDIEITESAENVGSVAVGVGEGVAWIVDSTIDTTAHMPASCQPSISKKTQTDALIGKGLGSQVGVIESNSKNAFLKL